MKKLLLVFSLFAANVAIAQTIPCANMETWGNNTESPTTYLVPQHWITEDVFASYFFAGFGDSTYVAHSVNRVGSAHGGQYAAEMSVVTSNEGDTVLGAMTTAGNVVDIINAIFAGGGFGFQQSTRPAMLNGFYKFTQVGGDSAKVGIAMTHWNTSTNMRDTVVYPINLTLSAAAGWTAFSVPITYALGVYPDTAAISIGLDQSASGIGHPGSILTIDDLSFSGSVPAGVNSVTAAQASVSIYPNPFSESATIALDNYFMKNATLEIFDVTGKKVRTLTDLSGSTMQLDRESLDAGLYLYTISESGKTISTGKISVQ